MELNYKIHNLKRHDGSTYQGGIKNCLPSNFGVLKDPNGKIYKCEWRAGEINGLSNIIYSDGRVFLGSYLEGKKNGVGCVFYKGKVYLGEFMDGNRSGYGELVEFDQNVDPDFDLVQNLDVMDHKGNNLKINYETFNQNHEIKKFRVTHYKKGYFKDGKLQGYGQFSIPGKKYSFRGYFRKGYPSGQGIEKTNLGLYKGNFESGLRDGVGIFQGMTSYTGYWAKGKKDDYGIFKSNSGDIYEGFYTGGKRCGYGRMIQKNGEIFIGNYANSIKSGFGKVQRKGYVYIGEFDENEKDGLGYCKHVGDYSYLGEWKEGERSGIGYEVTRDDEFKGEFFMGKRHGRGILITPDKHSARVVYEYGEIVGEFQGSLYVVEEQFDEKKIDYFFESSEKKIKQVEKYLKDAQNKLEADLVSIKEDFSTENRELEQNISHNKKEFKSLKIDYSTLYDNFNLIRKYQMLGESAFDSIDTDTGHNYPSIDTRELEALESTQRLISYKMDRNQISVDNSIFKQEKSDFDILQNLKISGFTRDKSTNQFSKSDSFYNLCSNVDMSLEDSILTTNCFENVDYDIKIKALEIEKLKLEKQKMEMKNKKEKQRINQQEPEFIKVEEMKRSVTGSIADETSISVSTSQRSLSIFESNQFKHDFDDCDDLLYQSNDSKSYEEYESNFMTVTREGNFIDQGSKFSHDMQTADNSISQNPFNNKLANEFSTIDETVRRNELSVDCRVLVFKNQFYGKTDYKNILIVNNWVFLSGKSGIVKLEKLKLGNNNFKVTKVLQNINITSIRAKRDAGGETILAALIDNSSSMAILDGDLNLKEVIKHKKAVYESLTTSFMINMPICDFCINGDVVSWVKGHDICFGDIRQRKLVTILRGFFVVNSLSNMPKGLIIDFESQTILGVSEDSQNNSTRIYIHYASESTGAYFVRQMGEFGIFKKFEKLKKIKFLGKNVFIAIGSMIGGDVIMTLGLLNEGLEMLAAREFSKNEIDDLRSISFVHNSLLIAQDSTCNIIAIKISIGAKEKFQLKKMKINKKIFFKDFTLNSKKNKLMALCDDSCDEKIMAMPFDVEIVENPKIQIVDYKNIFQNISRVILSQVSNMNKSEPFDLNLDNIIVSEEKMQSPEIGFERYNWDKEQLELLRRYPKALEIVEKMKDQIKNFFVYKSKNFEGRLELILILRDTREMQVHQICPLLQPLTSKYFFESIPKSTYFDAKRGNLVVVDCLGTITVFNFDKKPSKMLIKNLIEFNKNESIDQILVNSDNSKHLVLKNNATMDFFSLKNGKKVIEYPHLFDSIHSSELSFYQNVVFVIGEKMNFSVLAAFNFTKKFTFVTDFLKKDKKFEKIFRIKGTDLLVLKMENEILLIKYKDEKFILEKEFKLPGNKIRDVWFCDASGIVLELQEGGSRCIWGENLGFDASDAGKKELSVRKDDTGAIVSDYKQDGSGIDVVFENEIFSN